MRKISADWIFPVSTSPIKNGVVVVDDVGKILQVAERRNFDLTELEIYSGIVCPGFINAHCHLELSYLKGRIAAHTGLTGFISEFIQKRNDADAEVKYALEKADQEMWDNGIVGVGDISNVAASFKLKAKSKIRYHTFIECFGLLPEKASFYFNKARKIYDEAKKISLSASVVPHAPYTMSPELFSLIKEEALVHRSILSYHNQETEEENKLFRGEASSFDAFYETLKLPKPEFKPAESSLASHLQYFPAELKVLFVHNAATSRGDIALAGKSHPRLYWCFCPNANLYIEDKLPSFQQFTNDNSKICLGTDSYASNHSLSILDEMKTIQKQDSSISLDQLIRWATLNGAAFFKWRSDLGSIEMGKHPGLNLITSIHDESFQLTESSKIQRLV